MESVWEMPSWFATPAQAAVSAQASRACPVLFWQLEASARPQPFQSWTEFSWSSAALEEQHLLGDGNGHVLGAGGEAVDTVEVGQAGRAGHLDAVAGDAVVRGDGLVRLEAALHALEPRLVVPATVLNQNSPSSVTERR